MPPLLTSKHKSRILYLNSVEGFMLKKTLKQTLDQTSIVGVDCLGGLVQLSLVTSGILSESCVQQEDL